MADNVIQNPVINLPFEEPRQHFRFDETGITSEIVPERRKSACFVPIPAPRRKGAQQLSLDVERVIFHHFPVLPPAPEQ